MAIRRPRKLNAVRSIKHYEAGTRGISSRIKMLCEARF
jgi:hypothetical protein